MNKYKFEISIEAANEQEAESKIKSASVLMQKLKLSELNKLADIVKNDPVRTALARKALGF